MKNEKGEKKIFIKKQKMMKEKLVERETALIRWMLSRKKLEKTNKKEPWKKVSKKKKEKFCDEDKH